MHLLAEFYHVLLGLHQLLPQAKKGEVKPEVTPTKRTDANKGSPFTRFISAANLDKDKLQDKDKINVSLFHSLPHSQESPEDTGEDRLERLLSEAVKEA